MQRNHDSFASSFCHPLQSLAHAAAFFSKHCSRVCPHHCCDTHPRSAPLRTSLEGIRHSHLAGSWSLFQDRQSSSLQGNSMFCRQFPFSCLSTRFLTPPAAILLVTVLLTDLLLVILHFFHSILLVLLLLSFLLRLRPLNCTSLLCLLYHLLTVLP